MLKYFLLNLIFILLTNDAFFVKVVSTEENNSESFVIVNTPLGKIKGSYHFTSRLGKKILSFRGIRYAEPPVGQQRFQPPVPAVNWTDILDATEEGPACPQGGMLAKNQSEDCLRLNVHTTKLPSDDEKVARPVIVYFHPGAFTDLSGQTFVVGPQYLLDHDIILVTINYRLSSLGFMSTGDSLLPGNLGLKDQVESLKWIQNNIAAFGGDPNSVTITGYSAGGWSVSLHLVSPMSKGLFHKAIAMSGAATYQELLPTHQKNLAVHQAELLGCPVDNVGTMLVCLNTKPWEDYSETANKFYEWYNNPVLTFSPVVEPEVRGVERFLPDQPINLIKQGKIHNVPLITGITKDEFAGKIVEMIQEARAGNDSKFKDLNNDWERLAPMNFLYERDTNRSKEISKKLREFYFKNEQINSKNAEKLGKLFADSLVIYPVHRFVNLVASSPDQIVYYYEFTYQGPISHVYWNDTAKPYGVVHHDDLLYLFKASFFPSFEKDSPEMRTIERMTTIWANFAKTGKPIPDKIELFDNIIWEPYTMTSNKYLEIGDKLTMKTNLNHDRMNFWDKTFALDLE